jgi:uncharacterized GH25 family protein
MKNLKKLFLLLCMTIGVQHTFAHALWIETETIGKKGKPHEVKIYYGEYATKELEEIDKWYSDVKDFSLWLITPGKEKVKLETQAGKNYFSANFVPNQDGNYILYIVHEAKELGGTTKYEFSSTATVNINKKDKIDINIVPNNLKTVTIESEIYKLNTPVKIKAVHNGQVFANILIQIFSAEGWSKQFTTDENGLLTFHPIWPGRYVVEISNYETKEGEHYNIKYDAIWQGSTTSFQVIK